MLVFVNLAFWELVTEAAVGSSRASFREHTWKQISSVISHFPQLASKAYHSATGTFFQSFKLAYELKPICQPRRDRVMALIPETCV